MATTSSEAALLHVALEDLHSGKTAQAARLPDLAETCSDSELSDLLRSEATRAANQADRISKAGVALAEPKNLWMNGILDDAERDTRQTEAGRLLDIALIGAIRKAKAAEIVSSETALALAQITGASDLEVVIAANRAEEIESDQRLKQRLAALCDLPPASLSKGVT